MICFSCQKEVSITGLVGRRDECPHCNSDLHSCLNCSHYDKNSYNECKEPQADVVKEKERANFCDYFAPGGQKKSAISKNDLLSAAEALFKKK